MFKNVCKFTGHNFATKSQYLILYKINILAKNKPILMIQMSIHIRKVYRFWICCLLFNYIQIKGQKSRSFFSAYYQQRLNRSVKLGLSWSQLKISLTAQVSWSRVESCMSQSQNIFNWFPCLVYFQTYSLDMRLVNNTTICTFSL
jgi:hypothetical protein